METKEFSTKSRVRGDLQARFCEKGRVKFPPTYSTKKSNRIAAKRYESVWNAFLKELPRNPTITLSSVQTKWHTNRKGMQRWIRLR